MLPPNSTVYSFPLPPVRLFDMNCTQEEKLTHSVDCGPKVNSSNTIFNWGGVKIAKITPELVVKFGSHVTASEAKSMIFVEENTKTLPVPKIFACYSYGPI